MVTLNRRLNLIIIQFMKRINNKKNKNLLNKLKNKIKMFNKTKIQTLKISKKLLNYKLLKDLLKNNLLKNHLLLVYIVKDI